MGVGAETCVGCDAVFIHDTEGAKLLMSGVLKPGDDDSESVLQCGELNRVLHTRQRRKCGMF